MLDERRGGRRGKMEGKKIEDGAKRCGETRGALKRGGIETGDETKNGRTGKV